MGSDVHYPEERPAHRVWLDGFWIDRYPVTNRDFASFVAATGYVTLVERRLDGSAVFSMPPGPVPLDDPSRWWRLVPGADWRHPRGPGSGIDGLEDHPVVHIAYDDAVAYATWAEGVLPSEAQWERAARGGLDAQPDTWGAASPTGAGALANVWCGEFPWRYEGGRTPGTTAVGEFPANGWGCHDMAGNVWEWTADYWRSSHDPLGLGSTSGSCCPVHRPAGPRTPSTDPFAPSTALRVLKGGSFLCSDDYCFRYRPAARIPQSEDSAACHIGFRCAYPG